MKKHPDLEQKLKLLYKLRLNRKVNNNAELSRTLKVSRQAIGSWTKGTPTRIGDRIPDNQVEPVAAAFGIHPYWFTLPYAGFESRVQRQVAAGAGPIDPAALRTSFTRMPPDGQELFGRQRELAALDQAWSSTDTNMLQLLGFGGIGKTALIGLWLARLQQKNYRGAVHIYTWSFLRRAQSAKASDMLKHALAWFGDPHPAAGNTQAQAMRLAGLIRDHRTLFILDGLESMQRPPGPAQGCLNSEGLALLLQELASDMDGLCVVSSRQQLTDLGPRPDARVHTLTPRPLNQSAAISLLRQRGVSGSTANFREAARLHGGNPLNLNRLAESLINDHGGRLTDAGHSGDGLAQEHDDPLLTGSTPPIVSATASHALDVSRDYMDWFPGGPEQQLLHIVSLLGRPLHSGELAALSVMEDADGMAGPLAKLGEAGLRDTTDRLALEGLVSRRTAADGYWLSCNPLLQEGIDTILHREQPASWKRLHGLIFRHLKNRLLEDGRSPGSELMFSAVRHGIKADRFMDAFDLYFNGIKRRLPMLPAGSHRTDRACIRLFFQQQDDIPPDSAAAMTRCRMLSSAATNFMSLGRLSEVMQPTRSSIRQLAGGGRLGEAANVALPFVSTLIVAGELDESAAALKELQGMVIGNPQLGASCDIFTGFVAHLRGQRAAAALLFADADQVLKLGAPGEAGTTTYSAFHCKFLLETGQYRQALDRALLTFHWRERGAWQTANDTVSSYARDLRVLGLACLALGEYQRAEELLQRQLAMLRASEELLCLPWALAARGQYLMETGDLGRARADFSESLSTAMNTGTRLGEWEGYLNLAALHLAGDDGDRAGRYLHKAQAMPGLGGFHFRDAEIHRMERQVMRLTGELPYTPHAPANPASFS